MHRLFLTEDCIAGNTVAITGSLIHRLCNVLRLGVGDHIVVLDNSGWEYEVELRTTDRSRLEGVVTGKSLAVGEPRTRITLYQALLKGSSFELVLQKCTEIGVTSFVPVICERCVAVEPAIDRLSRWKNIVLEAAQQSRRGKLPAVNNIAQFGKACEMAAGSSLLPWEEEGVRSVGDVLRSLPQAEDAPEVSIFVGPEGGFSASEVEYARSCGITPVSLGKRILKAETAGLVAATVALYEFGDLGGSN